MPVLSTPGIDECRFRKVERGKGWSTQPPGRNSSAYGHDITTHIAGAREILAIGVEKMELERGRGKRKG